MQIKSLIYGFVAAALLSPALPAAADPATPAQDEARDVREELRARWEAMTPEERQAHREEMQKRWAEMTPEERAAHRGMQRSPHAATPEHPDTDHDPHHGKAGDKVDASKAKDYGKAKEENKKQGDRDD